MRRAIIFDGDDTLWLTEQLYDSARKQARRVVEAAGLDGARWEALERSIDVENVGRLGLTTNRFPTSCVEAYRQICEDVAHAVDASVESAIRTAANTVFEHPAPLVPLAREALSALKARGFLLALLTKGDRELQQRRIEQSGLAPFFDLISIVPQKTPESITAVLTRLGVAAASAMSVGNSLRSDVSPALVAGVRPVWIDAHVWEYERGYNGPIDGRVIAAKDLSHLLRLAP